MKTTRRTFMQSLGVLTIGFALPFPEADELPGSLKKTPQVNAWLEILADGSVRVFTGKIEMGQGIRTAVAQMAAEELDLSIHQVEVVMADTERTPNETYTAGSASIENSAIAVRYAAAMARQKLLELAAQQFQTQVDRLEIKKGVIHYKRQQRRFSEVLQGQQIRDEVRMPVPLKPKHRYEWVGKPIHRGEIEKMVRAETWYVQDLRFPGMLHARIARPPSYESRLQSFNEAALQKQFPGLNKPIVNGSFIGIVGPDEFEVTQAQTWLKNQIRWSEGKPLPAQKALVTYLKSLPGKTDKVTQRGQVTSNATWKARYVKPYLMHGSIGPSCAVAWYQNKKLQIWTHSQGVYPLREAIHQMLDLPLEQIHVIGVAGSGCYGHNGADDVAAEAALLALAIPDTPIRLQWSREDEHAWEPYGSAMVFEVEARLDDQGYIQEWKYDLWSDTHSTRPGGNPENLLPARYLKKAFTSSKKLEVNGGMVRNSEPYYAIANLDITAHRFSGPLRVSALRSLGGYGNVLAIESFMDELAEKARKDPFDFRIMHLKDHRAIEVLKKLQLLIEKEPVRPNEGIGIAFARYKNTAAYCAVAARVSVVQSSVRVLKLWAVIDAGEVINSDGIKNQTEGGMIQSASWTIKEEVKFDTHQPVSRDWYSYPILRMSEIPEVEVEVINRPEEKPLGAGEAVQGPTAAALANAYYRASGHRVRDFPLLKESYQEQITPND
ncbi:molybdopterin cofactor-binding domain-containing protein [Siphonobacter sp. SORGH_AS_1065]|uniref:molybdopterin cofactor-binding domain-containing protein n=1 Tax=Siphonobacter sp. SORGH_AS_1065 TaxID=3041795 RepID=UPI002781DEDF|nr:molybdopterin cofactor-binding domain-containing protein [Siphonobacter sp. SORGH_AS_1065]MDQ1089648.1 nicotinate dehydrogenase subunit B [Siphonobacter sp. SORGH_AS_1065]